MFTIFNFTLKWTKWDIRVRLASSYRRQDSPTWRRPWRRREGLSYAALTWAGCSHVDRWCLPARVSLRGSTCASPPRRQSVHCQVLLVKKKPYYREHQNQFNLWKTNVRKVGRLWFWWKDLLFYNHKNIFKHDIRLISIIYLPKIHKKNFEGNII